MKNAAMNEMMKQIKGLTSEDKQDLINQILEMMSESTPKKESCHELVAQSTGNRPNCPHCGTHANTGKILRRGYNRNGAQRFYCKECGRFFVPSTNTALAHTHKDADIWRQFIEMTIKGESIAACAAECGIAYQTAFTWRHKVLNVFHAAQQETVMDGIVEADEMLINISYKGNHVAGGFGNRQKLPGVVNNMPREAYKRGTDNKSTSSKEKSCVFCMVENGDKRFFAAVPGAGFMVDPMLDATLPRHVDKDSAMLLVDQYKVTRNYLDKNGFKSLVLASNTSDNPHDHKPEIKDGLHMQHVNAMHHHIRNFLKPYCGVSSKYLSNYISMFVWIKNNAIQRQRKTALDAAEQFVARTNCYMSGKAILARPMVPQCA